jgi:multiple sugar transport system permease protein
MQTFAIPPAWFFTPTFENYQIAIFGYAGSAVEWTKAPLGSGLLYPLLNSLIIGACSMVISVITGTVAAYALARFNFWGRRNIASWILSTRMGPPVAMVIPIFYVANIFGLVDTHLIVILTHTIIQLPFTIWVMMGFFKEIPKDLVDSALIDGCVQWDAFWRIVMPISKPGVVTVAIFSFIFSWCDLLFALVLTRTIAKTATIATVGYVEEKGILWGPLSASATLMLIPVLILVLFIQKHIVRGLTFGAIKG